MNANHATRDDLTGLLVAGKYRVTRPIGHGLVGTVYLCEQESTQEQLALKVLHPELTRMAGMTARFFREVRTPARLRHPNIVPILDYGEDAQNGLLFLTMPYVDGRSLRRILAEDWPLSDERVVELMSQILTGLTGAHAAGLVHTDLNLENILVCPALEAGETEQVLLVDFGLAPLAPVLLTGSARNARNSSVRLQQASGYGRIVGSPDYASPEHARGEPLDPRSDIYSAGIVLFQLLTRTLPFVADSPFEVILQQCGAPPPPPSGFAPVSKGLEAACLKALSKTRDARFQTAREMQSALHAVLTEAAAAAAPKRRTSQPPAREPSDRASRVERPASIAPEPAQLPAETTSLVLESTSVEPAHVEAMHVEPAEQSPATQPSAEPAPRSRPNSLAPMEREPAPELDHIPKRRSASVVLATLGVGLVVGGIWLPLSARDSKRTLQREIAAAAPQHSARRTLTSTPLILPSAENVEPEQDEIVEPVEPTPPQPSAESTAQQPARAVAPQPPQPPQPKVATRQASVIKMQPASSPDTAAPVPPSERQDQLRLRDSVHDEPALVQPLRVDDSRSVAAPTEPAVKDTELAELAFVHPAKTGMEDLELGAGSAYAVRTPTPEATQQPPTEAVVEPEVHTPPSAANETPQQPPTKAVVEPEAHTPPSAASETPRGEISIGAVFTRAPVPGAIVRQAIDRRAMIECYRNVLRDSGGPRHSLEGRLDIETNANGRVRFAGLHGAELTQPLRSCIEHVARAGRITHPAAGHLEASVTLVFEPR